MNDNKINLTNSTKFINNLDIFDNHLRKLFDRIQQTY